LKTEPKPPDYRESADDYDSQVKDYDAWGHNVIFGMTFEFVDKGQKLLDLGIGTGLASQPFARIGLAVHGLDADPDMLAACRTKGFATALKHHDLTAGPIPYPDRTFHHVICCGVLHFLGDLSALFSEVKRVLKPGGVFAFSFAPAENETDYRQEPTAWGVPIFRHGPRYIQNRLQVVNLSQLKEQRLLLKGADRVTYDMLFAVLITRCA
jgi:predicted TPR repeat methyltransferase